MWLLAITIVVAAVLVLLTRGGFVELSQISIRGTWLMVVGLGIQIALEFIEVPKDQIETLGYGPLMVSYAFLIAFCLANLKTAGFGLITLGIALNMLVIGLNQGMPTAPVQEDKSGKRIEKPIEQTVKHRPAGNDDLLDFLGDRIVLPEPVDSVISAGDIALSLGICELAYFGSRRKRRRRAGTHRRVPTSPRAPTARSRAPRTRPS